MAINVPMESLEKVIYKGNELEELNIAGCKWRKPYTLTLTGADVDGYLLDEISVYRQTHNPANNVDWTGQYDQNNTTFKKLRDDYIEVEAFNQHSYGPTITIIDLETGDTVTSRDTNSLLTSGDAEIVIQPTLAPPKIISTFIKHNRVDGYSAHCQLKNVALVDANVRVDWYNADGTSNGGMALSVPKGTEKITAMYGFEQSPEGGKVKLTSSADGWFRSDLVSKTISPMRLDEPWNNDTVEEINYDENWHYKYNVHFTIHNSSIVPVVLHYTCTSPEGGQFHVMHGAGDVLDALGGETDLTFNYDGYVLNIQVWFTQYIEDITKYTGDICSDSPKLSLQAYVYEPDPDTTTA